MGGQCLTEVREVIEPVSSTKLPRRYKVLLLNDDYTPMDFVVLVLMRFFHFSESKAIGIMLQVHFLGKAVCGVFTKDIAETIVVEVNRFSQNNGYPLTCAMEQE